MVARPACGLYLVTPVGLATGAIPLDLFARDCAAVLDAVPIEALLLRTLGLEGQNAEAALTLQIERLRPLAHQRGVPLVLEGRADLAAQLGCDGVHLAAARRTIQAVRRAMGEDAIIGAEAGASRHEAMEAGEAGADYVTFGFLAPEPQSPSIELLTWWQEMMELPCVAMGDITLQNAVELAAAGADFLAVREVVWNHPQGPAKAIKILRRLLAES